MEPNSDIPREKTIQIDIPESLPESIANPANNWTEENIQTVKAWLNTLTEASFICSIVLTKYQHRLNRCLIVALIFSSIATIITGISSLSLTVDTKTYNIISLALNIFLFILTALITIINGSIKILKFDDLIASLSSYIEKADCFRTTLISQLILPDDLRDDAINFIKVNSTTYTTLLGIIPNISPADYIEAKNQFGQFKTEKGINNFQCTQKYNYGTFNKKVV